MWRLSTRQVLNSKIIYKSLRARQFATNLTAWRTDGVELGQQIEGLRGRYILTQSLQRNVWKAVNQDSATVIAKTAPHYLLNKVTQILADFSHVSGLRRVLDQCPNQSFMILEYLDDNLLHASDQQRLERADIKRVARVILTVLNALHSEGWTHADIKPNNVLVNYGQGAPRFTDIQLADFGDCSQIAPDADPLTGPMMGAAMFRSPEVLLELRWRSPTDMWSFGATIISLILGHGKHLFNPPTKYDNPEDEARLATILLKQIAYFGYTISDDFADIADHDRMDVLNYHRNLAPNHGYWAPFNMARDISQVDKDFICRIMQFDPRRRPTAAELLKDKWFDEE